MRLKWVTLNYNLARSSEFDHPRFTLNIRFKKEERDSLKSLLEPVLVAKYNSEDTCLLITNVFTNRGNWHKLNKANSSLRKYYLEKECLKDKYPVPNFWENKIATVETPCKLPKGYELFVLEAGNEIVFDKSKISKQKAMPLVWEHGYSKGVAISNRHEEVIYWLIIW